MNSRQYVARMVKPVAIPFITRLPNGILQLDNARLLTTFKTRNSLENVRILDWPTWSPDFYPKSMSGIRWEDVCGRTRDPINTRYARPP